MGMDRAGRAPIPAKFACLCWARPSGLQSHDWGGRQEGTFQRRVSNPRGAPAGAPPPWALGLCAQGGCVAITTAASRTWGNGFAQPSPLLRAYCVRGTPTGLPHCVVTDWHKGGPEAGEHVETLGPPKVILKLGLEGKVDV